MSRSKRREVLRRHLERWIDRARFPDYVLTDADLEAYVAHESTGLGRKPEALAWVKATEEITVHQLWSEMAEMWSRGFGWFHVLDHTMRCEWGERDGSNIWLKKLISIARGIRRKGFMDAMISYTGFTTEQRNGYLATRFPDPT